MKDQRKATGDWELGINPFRRDNPEERDQKTDRIYRIINH
jgi:hypothetical protein